MSSSQATPPKKSKRPPARELDTINATKAVWLVKVPKYLSDTWKRAVPSQDLGILKISSNPQKVDVSFSLSEELAQLGAEKIGTGLPRDHRVLTQNISSQTLSVFTEGGAANEVIAEGRITQKSDIQPLNSTVYMKLKEHQIKAAGKTKNQATKIDHTPVMNKPVDHHKEHAVPKGGEKRARKSRASVLDLIFHAFQNHQYYTFRDLVNMTEQPPIYLKELLKEVCVYNTKSPHKNTWELKPEYRHYSKD